MAIVTTTGTSIVVLAIPGVAITRCAAVRGTSCAAATAQGKLPQLASQFLHLQHLQPNLLGLFVQSSLVPLHLRLHLLQFGHILPQQTLATCPFLGLGALQQCDSTLEFRLLLTPLSFLLEGGRGG